MMLIREQDILHEISTLLVRYDGLRSIRQRDRYLTYAHLQNTQLDRQSLSYCVSLIENGVNPEALAVSPAGTLHIHLSLIHI